MGVISIAMPVNKRLILLMISALILAFFINQAINLAQEGMRSSLQAGEIEQSTTAPAAILKATIGETTEKIATKTSQLERAPGEAYGSEGERPLGQKEPSLPLNLVFSLIAAASAFFLARRTKLK
ncbi:MAG: hypothetical protein QXJ99_04440 [Thermofilum sp.]